MKGLNFTKLIAHPPVSAACGAWVRGTALQQMGSEMEDQESKQLKRWNSRVWGDQ